MYWHKDCLLTFDYTAENRLSVSIVLHSQTAVCIAPTICVQLLELVYTDSKDLAASTGELSVHIIVVLSRLTASTPL